MWFWGKKKREEVKRKQEEARRREVYGTSMDEPSISPNPMMGVMAADSNLSSESCARGYSGYSRDDGSSGSSCYSGSDSSSSSSSDSSSSSSSCSCD